MTSRGSRSRSTGCLVAVAAGLLAGVVLIVTGYLMAPTTAPPATAVGRPEAGQVSSSAPGDPPSPSPSPSTGPPMPSGTGAGPGAAPAGSRWTYAMTTGTRAGAAGRPLRYRVAVENGTGQSVEAFAEHIDATFASPRGWTAGGRWSFQRVSSGQVDFTIWLATPASTDKICARYGLDTAGVLSCRGGPDVVINLIRWTQGIPSYAGAVSDYDHLVVNHEAGHYLGFGHARCPGSGAPAPVMMVQYYGLNGCAPNVWPYSAGGTLLTGPAA